MTDERSRLTRAREGVLDVVFYGPVGVLATIGDRMPGYAREGREVVHQRVELYRMVGKMAVRHGQAKVNARVTRPQHAGDQGGEADVDVPAETAGEAAEGAPLVEPHAPAEPPPAVPSAIADYDSLAASQVVARLAGLSDQELEAVRRYEEHHRARRTILGKIQQLQTAA
jgi:hypothetical protein